MGKIYMKLSEEERSILLRSLVDMRNRLVEQGRFADPVNELILKLADI